MPRLIAGIPEGVVLGGGDDTIAQLEIYELILMRPDRAELPCLLFVDGLLIHRGEVDLELLSSLPTRGTVSLAGICPRIIARSPESTPLGVREAFVIVRHAELEPA